MDQYGPFLNIVALALALVAVFSTLLVKMLGKIGRWTWLAGGASPPFLITAGPRMLAVVLMAITYATINRSNYFWYGLAAVVFAVFGFWSVVRFNRLRNLHVAEIPLIGPDGQQLTNAKGEPLFGNVIIALESQMRKDAKDALDEARKKMGGISLVQFMSGYGATKLYDPEALWDRGVLADTRNSLSISLMYIVLCSVMTLFLAAFIIEVFNKNSLTT